MQQNNSSKVTYIALAIIVVITIGIYLYLNGSKPSDALTSIETIGTVESTEAQMAANRVLSLLNQISSLKIDDTIFQSAVYRSLVDYTITIPEQNVGRVNPFAPISGQAPSSSIKIPSGSVR